MDAKGVKLGEIRDVLVEYCALPRARAGILVQEPGDNHVLMSLP